MSAIASFSSSLPTQATSFSSSITTVGSSAGTVQAASSLTIGGSQGSGGAGLFLGAMSEMFGNADLGKMLAAMIILNTLFGEDSQKSGKGGMDPKDLLMGLVALGAMSQASSTISSSLSISTGNSNACAAYTGGSGQHTTSSTFSVIA